MVDGETTETTPRLTDTKFKKGNTFGKGRPPKLKTQVKDFIKEHPYAVETLMTVLYERGIKGDREAAIYIIDRIKGKPKATLGIAEEDKELLTVATVIEFRRMIDRKQIEEGYIEGQVVTEGADEEEGRALQG